MEVDEAKALWYSLRTIQECGAELGTATFVDGGKASVRTTEAGNISITITKEDNNA